MKRNRQETRDIRYRPYLEPVGLALASNGTACITWKSPKSDVQTDVKLYARNSQLMDAQSYGKRYSAFLALSSEAFPTKTALYGSVAPGNSLGSGDTIALCTGQRPFLDGNEFGNRSIMLEMTSSKTAYS